MTAIVLVLMPLACGGLRTGVAFPPTPKVTHEDALAACGLTGTVDTLPYSSERAHVEISEDCAVTLGEAIGLNWESFGANPRTFAQPDTSAELLVSAAWTLMATNLGAVEDGCEMLQDDVELCRTIMQFGRPDEGLNPSLFEIVSAYTDETVAAWEEDEATARNTGGVVSWSAPIVLTYDPSDAMRVSPLIVGSAMVHEASHGFLGNHMDNCNHASPCDPDGGGAYGASVMFLGLRFWSDRPSDPIQCEDELVETILICNNRIEDTTGVPPCELVTTWSC